jgi:hypothetical protein
VLASPRSIVESAARPPEGHGPSHPTARTSVTNRVRNTLICATVLGLLLAAAPAWASYQDVIRDCAQDGQLDGHYSQSELKKAGDRLPSDLDEYSDCREVIAAASSGGRGRGSAGGAGGSGGTVSPREGTARQHDQAALGSLARRHRKPRVDVGGSSVEPGKNGLFNTAGDANGMPLALLLALIAIGLLAMGGGTYALRRRIPALSNFSLPRPSLSRVPLPRLRR